MSIHRVRLNPTLLAVAISGIHWTSAHAQLGPEIPEVVVTAQRAPSPESRTPVAMSVLSGDRLAEAGIDRPSALGARGCRTSTSMARPTA